MARRLTDTDKWKKKWFYSLDMKGKLLWFYLLDNCDNAGFIKINAEKISSDIKTNFTKEEILDSLKKHLVKINDDLVWIPKFIQFQYPKGLSQNCKPHQSVIKMLNSQNIDWKYSNLNFSFKINTSQTLWRKKGANINDIQTLKEQKNEFLDVFGNNINNPQTLSKPFGKGYPPTKLPTTSAQLEASRSCWKSYSNAFETRYKTQPIRNAKVNAQIKMFVKRVGSDAPAIAEFYIFHNDRFYVQNAHVVSLLLRDAEKLAVEYKTKKKITHTRADQVDTIQTNVDAVTEAFEWFNANGGFENEGAGNSTSNVIDVQHKNVERGLTDLSNGPKTI